MKSEMKKLTLTTMKTVFTITILIYIMLMTSIAWSDIIHVPGDYPTIQAGIDAAVDDDTVLVADGTWTGDGNKNLDFGGKAITVTSENGAKYCIIDCEGDGRGFYFHSDESEDSIVSGFTIQNGSLSPSGKGGGIYCYHSSPTIANCTITDNRVDWLGGGIYCYYSDPTITNCTIRRNTADGGGGIFCSDYSSPTITNSTITGNTGGAGAAGIECFKSSLSITNCTIADNGWGGGVMFWYGSPTVTNCILWNNPGGEIGVYESNPVVTYSDIQGGWPGEGNIDADPLFVEPDNGNYHLQPGSPCIDAGTNDAPALPDTDFEGDPRIIDGDGDGVAIVDMGADEYQGVGTISIEIISPVDGEEFSVGAIVDVVVEVRDELGEPMAGVEVTFEATGGTVEPTTALTDATGQAVSQLTVAEGENTVTATLTEYPDISDTVTVIGVVGTGSINGTVTDLVGFPVGALVIAVKESVKKGTLTELPNGYYEILALEPGTYWVICIKKGYKLGIRQAEVVAGGETTVDFKLRRKQE